MNYYQDGSVLSGATRTSRGGDSRKPADLPTTGTVVRYRPAESGTIPLVDLLLGGRGWRCDGVPFMSGGAAGNGEQWSPSPCTQGRIGGAMAPFDQSLWGEYDPDTLDGDRMAVLFLDGDPGRPFAIPMPSRAATYPAAADGCVRRILHQGTAISLLANGGIDIDASGAGTDNAGRPTGAPGGLTISVAASAAVNVMVDGQDRLTLDSGSVTADAPFVNLGANADEPAIKATTFYLWLAVILTALKAHEHPVSGAVAGSSATLQALPDPPETAKSKKAALE